jgi:CheY-like chemotaxis protein
LEIILFPKYDVETAVNGFEGLEKAKKRIPDLIITDILMPVMDGIRFFNNIRKENGLLKIPVIALTNFSNNYPQKSLISMGFSAAIPKPVTKKALLSTVKKLIEEEA